MHKIAHIIISRFIQKLPYVDDECEKYFTRIAKNYVELLLSVDPWFRDKFFNVSFWILLGIVINFIVSH